MKKTIGILFLIVGFTSNTFAQQAKGDIELGADIGYNFSNALNALDYYGVNSGFNFGVATDYYFSNRWSIKGKLIYDQKGWDDSDLLFLGTFPIELDSKNIVYSLNYLTVPVMANYHFGKKRNWYLNFGPYVGFLLNAEDNLNRSDIQNDIYSTDFGFDYGIGVKFPVSNELKFFLEFDEQVGMKNVLKDDYQGDTINVRGSFNFGVNYTLK